MIEYLLHAKWSNFWVMQYESYKANAKCLENSVYQISWKSLENWLSNQQFQL